MKPAEISFTPVDNHRLANLCGALDENLRQIQTALDVGITRTEAGLVGDVAPDVMDVAGFVAPMPGGVGPMTRAMLLANVVEAAERSAQ